MKKIINNNLYLIIVVLSFLIPSFLLFFNDENQNLSIMNDENENQYGPRLDQEN